MQQKILNYRVIIEPYRQKGKKTSTLRSVLPWVFLTGELLLRLY